MKIIINIFLLLSIIVIPNQADEVEVQDREVSVRKAIDTFGKIEQKEISTVNKMKQMFSEGKVTGQLRSVYAGYNQEELGAKDSYATAIGGMLKYELASFNGFNAGVAFTTSHDINSLTGSADKQNSELSSPNGDYTALSELYLNYQNGGFNIRVGRQMIDTPLADTDDIRMVPNTFEALMATYEMDTFTFTLGNVQRWQGSDSGLGFNENEVEQGSKWVEAGQNGTWLGGVGYDDLFEFNAWYYDISKKQNASKTTYFDIGNHKAEGDITIHGSLQYLNQRESDSSGVDSDIYGALLEVAVYGAGFNIAYNKSKKHDGKRSFSGIGGGYLYTNMDTMILDEITEDREAEALVLGLVYDVNNWSFLYSYGDFKGDANSNGVKAHITEQDFGIEYNVRDNFVLAAIFVMEEDKLSNAKTSNDWNRLQVMAKYNF